MSYFLAMTLDNFVKLKCRVLVLEFRKPSKCNNMILNADDENIDQVPWEIDFLMGLKESNSSKFLLKLLSSNSFDFTILTRAVATCRTAVLYVNVHAGL